MASLFGGKKTKSKTTQTSDRDFEEEVLTNQTNTENLSRQTTGQERTSGLQSQQQMQTTTLLAPEVQQLLTGFLTNFAGGLDGGNVIDPAIMQAITGNLTAATGVRDRAVNAQGAIDANIENIIAESRRAGTQQMLQNNNKIATQAGSSFNTFSQLAANQGVADLESKLAGAAGQLGLAGRELATNEIIAGLTAADTAAGRAVAAQTGGGESAANVLASISQILKGATAQTVGTGETRTDQATQQDQQITQLNEVIAALTSSRNIDEFITQISKTKSKESGNIMGQITDFMKAAGSLASGVGGTSGIIN